MNELSNVLNGLETNNSIENCIFFNNTSSKAGGALYLFMPGDLTIVRCVFYKNIALDGSAIYYEEADQKTLFLKSNNFDQNVGENGAALYVGSSWAIIIESCNFTNNSLQQNITLGAIVFLENPGKLSIKFSRFENNFFGSVNISFIFVYFH